MSEFTAPSVEELQARFPSHQIESFIAQGGMGAVYLATQTSLERPVAIKILPQEFGEDEDYRVSFETEAKAMARLNHSNLVGIYDFGDLNGMLFIIMEYIPGRSLFDIAHGQQVDQVEAASLIRDMCYGLDHAHTAGMLHRDIKPANVLIDDEGRPKIVDFGLARPLGEEQSDGVVFGTPGYTAPEVLTNPFAVDQRSDIFSMGVMLYEMLTGHLPGDPIIPASAVSGSDHRFDTILNKAIHPDPDQRYHTAGEMAAELEEWIKKFEQTPGLVTTGALARRSTVFGGRPMLGSGMVTTPGGMPVVMSGKSGGNAGLVVGLIAAVAVAVVVMANMGGDNKPKGPTTAELKAQHQLEAQELLDAEEMRLAEVAKKKQQAKQREEKIRREEEEREASKREEKERAEALAEENREQEQEQLRLKKEEEARALAMAEAEAAKNAEDVPVYDHVGFIVKNRVDISKRVATVVKDYKEEIAKTIDREERSALRAVKRSTQGDRTETLEGKVEDYFAEWREGGEKPELPNGITDKVEDSLNDFGDKITKLDEKFAIELTRYQDTYAKELSAMSELLEKENVTKSVTYIKAELDALDKKGYFLAIAESKDPQPDTFAEEGEGDDEEE